MSSHGIIENQLQLGAILPYPGLCTVVNEFPNQLLAFFKAASHDELGVRGQVECLSAVRPYLNEAVVCRGLSRSLIV
jgi:hypothetical protein